MEHIPTDRDMFRQTLIDLGIHATQIVDGFDLEPAASFRTLPGVYTPANTIPTLTSVFRLFRDKYNVAGQHRYTSDTRFCGSEIARDLTGHLDSTDPREVVTYMHDLHARTAAFLTEHDITPSQQNVGTLMALVTARCPGHNRGNIAALPHCSGDLAYRNVYLPFLAAGATLTDIVTACAKCIGKPMPVTYLMATTPVRYGVFNLHDHDHTLDSIELGIYGD